MKPGKASGRHRSERLQLALRGLELRVQVRHHLLIPIAGAGMGQALFQPGDVLVQLVRFRGHVDPLASDAGRAAAGVDETQAIHQRADEPLGLVADPGVVEPRVTTQRFDEHAQRLEEPRITGVVQTRALTRLSEQGLGAGFVPDILDRSVIDKIIEVSDVAAERMARRLAREEGLLVGPSSGANVHAALEAANELQSGNVVTILCDSGERYLF